MSSTQDSRKWLEILLTPLVVALTGGLITFAVSQTEARNTKSREHEARQLQLLEIVSNYIASEDPRTRLLAVGLGGGLDPELSSRIATAVNLEVETSWHERSAVRRWRTHSIATLLATKSFSRAKDTSPIEGIWLLEPTELYGEGLIVNWLYFWPNPKQPTELFACGDTWSGVGRFDGKSGEYKWIFTEKSPVSKQHQMQGRYGITQFYVDGSGIMYGKVEELGKDKVRGLNWTYSATRSNENDLVHILANQRVSSERMSGKITAPPGEEEITLQREYKRNRSIVRDWFLSRLKECGDMPMASSDFRKRLASTRSLSRDP